MKIKPLSNNIIIEAVKEEEKTKGGILLPQTAEKDRPQQGKVVAVGPGKTNSQGKVIPMSIKKGDTILFSKYGPHEIKVDNKDYLVLSQDDVLAIIE
ncbi:MAG: co-chaperone GroES [Candidatus Pacebacteria bacterium]|nr:co-chaperone GroES [Candidatus Paceibacterota bacterium]MDD4074137.1 co-chaperone GroES [Candidatus Paceibacterota bacterium]